MSRRTASKTDDEKRDMCLSCTLPAWACDSDMHCTYLKTYGSQKAMPVLRQDSCGFRVKDDMGSVFAFTTRGKRRTMRRAGCEAI